MKSSDAISIGMGMGVSEDLYKTLDYLIHNYSKTLIIDADALNTISKYGIDVLNNHKANIVLTPHPKEAERLSGIAVKDILDNPILFAKEFAKKYNLILLLKGASTTISNGDIIKISAFGNSGLAKGGSGDALSGILCGIMATNGYSINNVALGSYILGMACVKACKNCSERSVTISAISMHIGEVLKEIEK
jgi:NAD(P)H-hydrate epimerase